MYVAKIELSPVLTIEIEAPEGQKPAEGQKAIIEGVAFWQGIPTECGICQAPVVFTARHPKTFHYYGLKCQGPSPHEMNFGERKDGSSLYVKDGEWQDAYGGGEQQEEQAPQTQQRTTQPAQKAQTAAKPSPTGDTGALTTKTMVTLMRRAKEVEVSDMVQFAKELLGDPVAHIKVTKDLTEAQGLEVLDALNVM